MHHQFGFGRGAGGEVKLQGIAGASPAIGLKRGGRCVALFVLMPALSFAADCDASAASACSFDPGRKLGGADNMPHVAAGNAVCQIIGGEQRGCRNDNCAELDHGQHGFPQRRNIAEHEQHAVATLDAKTAKIIGDAVRPLREFGERQLVLAAIFISHPERGLGAAIAGGNLVKPVQCPVEAIKLWPLESCVCRGVVVAMSEKEVAGGAESLCGRCHLSSIPTLSLSKGREPFCKKSLTQILLSKSCDLELRSITHIVLDAI